MYFLSLASFPEVVLYLVIWPNLDVDVKESKKCEHYFKLKIGVSVTKDKEENDISIDN